MECWSCLVKKFSTPEIFSDKEGVDFGLIITNQVRDTRACSEIIQVSNLIITNQVRDTWACSEIIQVSGLIITN